MRSLMDVRNQSGELGLWRTPNRVVSAQAGVDIECIAPETRVGYFRTPVWAETTGELQLSATKYFVSA